jgi:hypothetical protein
MLNSDSPNAFVFHFLDDACACGNRNGALPGIDFQTRRHSSPRIVNTRTSTFESLIFAVAHFTVMKLICASAAKELILTQALAALLSAPPPIIEEDAATRLPNACPRRSPSSHSPTRSTPRPSAASSRSLQTRDVATMPGRLIADTEPLLVAPSDVASVYFHSFLGVLAALGAPCGAPALALDVPALADEAIPFARDALGIAERYAMSPPPAKPLYFSTPIYCVNGAPHIGHIFTTTLVDSLARWYRLRQIPVTYSTGMDEHGLKVQTTAQSRGQTPQA